MKDTVKCYPLVKLGYKNDYEITAQGFILNRTNKNIVKANKKNCYTLTLENGKRVQRSFKRLYRQAFGKEYARDLIVNLPGEIWKEIDATGKYYISNQGRVKSYQGNNAKILKPYQNQKGYFRIDIYTGNRKTYLLHILVANAFVQNDNPKIKNTVDHIDGNKRNNKASNLQWLSIQDNIKAYYERNKEKVQSNGRN